MESKNQLDVKEDSFQANYIILQLRTLVMETKQNLLTAIQGLSSARNREKARGEIATMQVSMPAVDEPADGKKPSTAASSVTSSKAFEMPSSKDIPLYSPDDSIHAFLAQMKAVLVALSKDESIWVRVLVLSLKDHPSHQVWIHDNLVLPGLT